MINTSLFTLFLVTSAFAVATPGPGVLMTLTSSIRYGLRTAVWVILGTSTGTVVMSMISSTGLGILIATSPAAYETIKALGALYMVYLGVRLFKAKPFSFDLASKEKAMSVTVKQKGTLWLQGITLQMTNPMLIMFFVSLFPQFIDHELAFVPQVVVMTVTYFCTVFCIHFCYGWIASNFRRLLSTPKAAKVINCVGGAFFLFLAARVFVDMLQ
ncbi:MAG TPA: LysE family translocator [Candidatus Aphodousia faecavium]|uniref:LysE family translocator n=1 Tax=Parasutterella secunda TaxID=626947 RepID=A0ABS2GSB5_9BURK|nr:LysE family translocator [Parasutterella secunda]MBM6928730.1 LysE family translocator [Parasutterella secunda]HIT95857.1 LysE family translocator [Candidatus Aphodousia faecavium]